MNSAQVESIAHCFYGNARICRWDFRHHIVTQIQFEVVGVITAADKPAGRGQKIKYSAVKEYALANTTKRLLQPTNLKDESIFSRITKH